MKMTPMLQQFFEAKDSAPGALLFFRMGDFYELFFDDAKIASDVLDLTLTARNNKGDPKDRIPMAGVPHHAAAGYIQRLVDAGYKVAICEQLEDPSKTKKIVKRGVVRVVTPGVCLNVDESRARESNFLAAAAPTGKKSTGFGVALMDVSTGEVRITEVANSASLLHELERAQARELLLPESVVIPPGDHNLHLTVVGKATYSASGLSRHLREMQTQQSRRELVHGTSLEPRAVEALVNVVEGLSLRHVRAVKAALCALFHYVASAQRGIPAHIAAPEVFRPQDYVALDAATEANLEIFKALLGGGRAGSLLSVIDKTVTAAGSRLLRTRLAYPLVDTNRINQRLDAVEVLTRTEIRRDKLRTLLRNVADIPRLTSRVVTGGGNGRDLVALANSLSQIPTLQALGEASDPTLLGAAFGRLDACEDLVGLLNRQLVDEPPVSIRDGGMFRTGFNPELDELIELSKSGNRWLLEHEQAQRVETGIDSLKLKYNRVFGYYLEVTKANLHKVPDHYIRKQTLASAERYFTPELKEYEDKILNAKDHRAALEAELLEQLVLHITNTSERLHQTARAMAELDVLAALAELAVRGRYVRPLVDNSSVTQIELGRHPVVEKTMSGERFVPNSVRIDAESEQLLLVTGPNMAGKSTIIRQVALITLLGQIGSFVPAGEARLGVVDQIFSRVGANDNLAQGQSTFMVEMTQTAHILAHATEKSLIILDEIGRGTSTFDGLSIAWAVAEHIIDVIGARTMFATHYHELTDLPRTRDRVVNVSVAVKEWNDDIVFLRRLISGPANQSYGIQVGRLAGLPNEVVERAKQVLANLETAAYGSGGIPALSFNPELPGPRASQMDLFAGPTLTASQARTLEALQETAVDELSPLAALNLIYRLKQDLESG